ncbi:Ig-like domain-containing protein [Polaribacter sp. HL-MS24]|uniref:Ig-like domain-containing protein n=1 Tax=Polaribacter sp. HL-MS24 TaxID=3077735 RepID=UPI0029345E96|nr:Ig-like domain-containing protein [Polaribacter sp. HL-MS24]WOC39504.1 Ig-like domain-containing protein [Polaribacter sp. HL-MS24]
MKNSISYTLFVIFTALLINCARTSRPDGGPKDELAPLMVTASPPYENLFFDKKKIKLSFNEFIKLKDLNKQLVISPPMKYPPIISPQGYASKFIEIKILDTLSKNTTYIFNFGNAIEDNNESNPLERFKYVFSTGSYIDSLESKGTIKDVLLNKPNSDFNVLLYRIDSAYTDSIVYREKPNYVTTTTDSIHFNFSNVQKGRYILVALKESVNDYLFDPQMDEIGFYPDTIQLPKDSILQDPIWVFKENLEFKFGRAKELKKGQLIFPFRGKHQDIQIEVLSEVPPHFQSISKFEKEKDTLNYWFTPFEADSLNFIISNENLKDTVTVKLRKNQLDTLSITGATKGLMHFRDTFFLRTNNPLVQIDTTKISIIDKDTLAVNFKSILNTKENKLALVFEKKPVQTYNISFLPEAFSDIYDFKNDSLKYRVKTIEIEDYGRITLTVNNPASKNYIIELLNSKLELVQRDFTTNSTTIVYDLLEPMEYIIRAIEDRNKNNVWDTGNYLKRRLPEKIIYFKDEDLTLRPNYYLNPVFRLND